MMCVIVTCVIVALQLRAIHNVPAGGWAHQTYIASVIQLLHKSCGDVDNVPSRDAKSQNHSSYQIIWWLNHNKTISLR